MNNLELWELTETIAREAWKNWNPHFEILTSGSGEKVIAFFILGDTDIEWNFYQSISEEIAGEFAVRMESAKEALLETVGFETEYEDAEATERAAEDMSENLSKLMKQYEETGSVLCWLTYRRLFLKEMQAFQKEEKDL